MEAKVTESEILTRIVVVAAAGAEGEALIIVAEGIWLEGVGGQATGHNKQTTISFLLRMNTM